MIVAEKIPIEVNTKSLCPVCYDVIPATILSLDNVWMRKHCQEHGGFVSMVERDPSWFWYCRQNGAPGVWDNGLFIDIVTIGITMIAVLSGRLMIFYKKRKRINS